MKWKLSRAGFSYFTSNQIRGTRTNSGPSSSYTTKFLARGWSGKCRFCWYSKGSSIWAAWLSGIRSEMLFSPLWTWEYSCIHLCVRAGTRSVTLPWSSSNIRCRDWACRTSFIPSLTASLTYAYVVFADHVIHKYEIAFFHALFQGQSVSKLGWHIILERVEIG